MLRRMECASVFLLLGILHGQTSPQTAEPKGVAKSEAEPAKSGAQAARDFYVLGDFNRVLPDNVACASNVDDFAVIVTSGSSSIPGHVVGLCYDRLEFNAALLAGQSPDRVSVRNTKTGAFVNVPYLPGLVFRQHTLSFFDEQGRYRDFCNEYDRELKNQIKVNPAVTVTPAEGVSDVRLIACAPDMIVLQFTAPVDYRMTVAAIVIGGQSVHLRALPGPSGLKALTNVSYTVNDTESVNKNFGRRIGDKYFVVDLHILNPSSKKVQLRKSAVWFAVDYSDQAAESGGKQYLYGRDHWIEHHPHDFLTVLGTFDDTTGKKAKIEKLVDLAIAAAAGVSGVWTTSGNYPKVVAFIAGIAKPAYNNVWNNPEEEKRKRTQLLQQSFADIIQIGPQSSETTKVFVPRALIDSQFVQPVYVRQIRDVHIELEVVSEAVSDLVAKGQLKLGMTQDQVVQALGLPDAITKADDKTTFRYVRGRYEFTYFNAEGKLFDWKERSIGEQVTQLVGSASAADILSLLNQVVRPQDEIRLADGGSLWPTPAGLDRSLRFGKDDRLAEVYSAEDSRAPKELLKKLVKNIDLVQTQAFLHVDVGQMLRVDLKSGFVVVTGGSRSATLKFNDDSILDIVDYTLSETDALKVSDAQSKKPDLGSISSRLTSLKKENLRPMVDGGYVWLDDEPARGLNLRFTQSRLLRDPYYIPASVRIRVLVDKKVDRKTIEQELLRLVPQSAVATRDAISNEIANGKSQNKVTYTSPDLKGQKIVIEYDGNGPGAKAKSLEESSN